VKRYEAPDGTIFERDDGEIVITDPRGWTARVPLADMRAFVDMLIPAMADSRGLSGATVL
jgi:hypothetical protein